MSPSQLMKCWCLWTCATILLYPSPLFTAYRYSVILFFIVLTLGLSGVLHAVVLAGYHLESICGTLKLQSRKELTQNVVDLIGSRKFGRVEPPREIILCSLNLWNSVV